MATRDFWNTYDPDEAKSEEFRWVASPPFPPPHDMFVSYPGPGGLFVYFGSEALS